MTIRWEEIEALSRRGNGDFPVVSLYLDVDGARTIGREHLVVLRDLIRGRQEDLRTLDLPRPAKGSVERDLEKIRDFLELRFDRKGSRGLAIFASDGAGLFERYPLPRPVGSRLIVDWTPYIRPLAALREEYPRWGITLLDKESARIFELDLGALEELVTIQGEAHKRVRAGGFRGYEEGRISRNLEDHLHRHLREVAERVHYLARARHHEGILLAGQPEITSALERFLPASVARRITGRFDLDIRAGVDEILERALGREEERVRETHRELLDQLIPTARKSGLAVLGIEAVLDMLHRGAVHTLVLGTDVTSSGYRCAECGRLTTLEGPCPSCAKDRKTPIPHLLDESVEEALRQGCQVRHVLASEELERAGSAGALLRFRP